MKEEIRALQEEYCKVVAEIVHEMLLLGFKAKEVVEGGLIWAVDKTDPEHKEVMAFVMTHPDKEPCILIEITPEFIAVKAPDDEQIISYRYLTSEGVIVSGFGISDLPFLRKIPEMIKKLDEEFTKRVNEYLKKLMV